MATRGSARPILIAVAGIVLLIGAGRLFEPIGRPLAVLLAAASTPLRSVGTAVHGALGAHDRSRVGTADLRAAIERLTAENARLRTLEADNAALKTALGYVERGEVKGIAARVVSESEDDSESALILDKGELDGVKAGQPVIVGDGVIVGKISRVGPHAATCLRLTDSRSRLAVAVQDKDGTVGVLQGDRGLAMEVTYIPQGAAIAPGNTVVTSGVEPAVRRGLLVGTVREIRDNSQDPFQAATIESLPSARYPLYVLVLDESVATADGTTQ